ncbi:DUF2341 domain-containing protein [Thermococcus sp.]|uniref:DUF2341 domain-containing protein n=1 Tax=Thermococcus sp. TaxID=35749 RepID=UPI00262E8083|nr:DUF2341 domain-containing protein [Thermococcus sp.]
MNSTVILLLIPLLLLLATYEDASSQIINSQSERTQVERTFDVVSYVALDFQKAMELSGKRAIVAVVDYVATTGNFIDPNYMANNTIRDLVLRGTTYSPVGNSPDVQRIMRNQDLKSWISNLATLLRKQGYTIEPSPSQIASSIELKVSPLDAFHVVIRGRIPNVTIRDLSGKVVYTGPIPRRGYIYSIISIQDLEDPMYSAMTGGRYHRSVRACNYAFPAFTPPFTAANGSGSGNSTVVPGLFGSDLQYNATTIWGPTEGYITNLTIDGSPVTTDKVVLKNGDMGVIAFNATSTGVSWCDASMEHKVDVSLPPSAPLNSLVLLVFDTASVSSSFGSAAHDGNRASIAIYPKGSCVPAPYWIEYWGSNKILIWLNTTSTRDYTIYYSIDPSLESSGNIGIFPYHAQDISLTAGSKKSSPLWTNVNWSSFFVRYSMTASSGASDFDAGIGINWNSTSSADYLVVTASYPVKVNDVQIPIYLNSTVASEILHDATTNKAEIGVYSDPQFKNPVPFWIEYWNDKGALIWIKGNLPGTYYIKYNTGTMTRGDGNEVFLFFDDFSYLNPGMSGSTIAQLLREHGWNVGGSSKYLSAGEGILKLRGDKNYYTPDIWLWTKKTFPYYRYVVGMDVYIKNQPFWMWYLDSTNWAWMEHVIGNYGYLGDFNIQTGEHDDKLDTGGRYKKNSWTHVEIAVEDWYDWLGYHYADFITYQNTTGPFTGTWSGNTKEVSYYSGYHAEINTAIGLGQFYKGPSQYKFIYVRKYLDPYYLSTTVKNVGNINVVQSAQFVDDNPGHPDLTESGNDWLVILKDWKAIKWSTQSTGYKNVPNRYEVDVVKGAGGLELTFTHSPNLTAQSTTETTLTGVSPPEFDVLTVIDNTQSNNAQFSWIVAAPYPYSSYSGAEIGVSTPQTKPSSAGAVARAYDLQPFINCLQDNRYFAISGGWSFFERLEGSNQNHDAYVALAHSMQDALGYKYGSSYYPIGLVSFMIPNANYDEKLLNLFNTLGITLDDESSADYYFLSHYFKDAPKIQGYQVWGISYGTYSGGDLSTVPFYIDRETAEEIFGTYGSNDLIER